MMEKYKILFEDEEIIVVVKPAGILSQGDQSNNPDMVSLIKGSLAIKRRREGKKIDSPLYVAVIHRLDRGVRGIMVYAKTKRAAAHLSSQLRNGDFDKTYLAVIDRRRDDSLEKKEEFQRLVSYLTYDKIKNISYLSTKEEGEKCILDYRVLVLSELQALIEIRLITGRKHQIRLQMREISKGIYGDRKYNEAGYFRSLDELALQCVSLAFFHPITQEKLNFQVEPVGSIFSRFN